MSQGILKLLLNEAAVYAVLRKMPFSSQCCFSRCRLGCRVWASTGRFLFGLSPHSHLVHRVDRMGLVYR